MCDMLDLLCIPYSGACDMFVTCDMLQYEKNNIKLIIHFRALFS